MSTLDSTSTEDEIAAAYMDNASYREDGDVAKAKAYITACEFMSMRGVSVIDRDGKRMEFDQRVIESQMQRAERFIAARRSVANGGFGIRQFTFGEFRG